MHILFADDQKEIRQLTANRLQRDGHTVVAVSNGPQALSEFDRASFDLVLLDEQMPAMSGVDVLHAIRATERGKHQIVIAVTGYNTEDDRRRLVHEGFDSVIGKPFRLDRLDAMLRETLNSRVSHANTPQYRDAVQVTSADLLHSVGGDPKLLLRMIRTFLRETPKRLALMESAIRLKRPDKLASFAHALKGSVAIFGATAAQQRCHQLQELGRKEELSDVARVFDLLKEEIAKLEANLRGYAGQISPSGSAARARSSRAESAARRKPR
jgi:CheY-like chemotaxis protein